MLTTKEVEYESEVMVGFIKCELISFFGKSITEADELVSKQGVKERLIRSPILLHDCPNGWALAILCNENDISAIEKYYT